MSFHSPDWENPAIDIYESESNPKLNQTESRTNYTPYICSPEPGAWTWGAPVPSPSLEKYETKDKK